MTLLAIILAFALFHWVHKPDGLSSMDWVRDLNLLLAEKIGIKASEARFVMLLLLPLLLLALLLELFNVSAIYHGNNAWYLLVHSLLLFYCLGPKPMETSIENGELLKQLTLTQSDSHKNLIVGMTNAALHRWFGVFVWYLVIGLWGAVFYRMAHQISQLKGDGQVFERWGSRLMSVLNFPAAVLMTLSLAVASDFEKVWHKCKPFLNGETLTGLNCQFLYDAMYHSVEHGEIESAENTADSEQDNDKQSENLNVVKTTMSVLKRMLVACLVFVALLVIFSAR